MQFLFAPVSHIRGFIIFQILFWHREIEVARAAAPGRTTSQYIARYRDFVISRDVHVAISVGFPRARSQTFRKFPQIFPRDDGGGAAFLLSSTLKQSIISRRFPSKRRYMVAVNSGIVQTTHTRLQFWFVAGQTSAAAFWHTFTHATIGNVAGILGYQGFSRQKVDMTSLKINEPIVGM